MPYYEIPHEPELTIEELRTRLGALIGDTVSDGGRVVVEKEFALYLTQVRGRTILRLDRAVVARMGYVRIVLLCLIPPFAVLLPYFTKRPQMLSGFTDVVNALGKAFPGIQRMKRWTGTPLTRPLLYRVLQVVWIATGAYLVESTIDGSSYWMSQPGFPMGGVIYYAIPFTLGGVWILCSLYKLFRPALGWVTVLAITLVLALSSPYIFRAYWMMQERLAWDGHAMDRYRDLPRGVLRPEYLMQQARLRSDQRNAGLKNDAVKGPLEDIVYIVTKFHPTDPAYQPAYQLAQQTLDRWD